MKKVSYEYGCRALGYTDGELYVDENMTDDEIRSQIEDMAGFGIYYSTEDGYEPVQETIYRKKR